MSIMADGFLYNMVRIMPVPLWRWERATVPEKIKTILDKRDRRFAGPTLPPQGLFLEEVYYREDS